MMRKLLAIVVSAACLAGHPSATDAQAKKRATLSRGMTFGGNSATDLQDLRKIGANLVVYQLHIPGSLIDNASIETYRTLLDQRLAELDPLVDLCGQIGLKMLLVLSSPPGGTASVTLPPLQRVFAEKAFQDELIVTWQTIATRYKGKTGIFGFDLLNEPQERTVQAGLSSWKELAPQIVNAIHAIDPTRTVVIEPPYGNPDLIRARTALIKDARVIYNIHTYFPSNFRNQGLNGRPINVVYPKGKLNRARLRLSLKKAILFQRKTKVKMIAGEFAAPRWAPKNSSTRLLRDYINIFESLGWDWALHAWREADVWSIEHTSDPANPNPSPTKTDRQVLLEKYFKRNK